MDIRFTIGDGPFGGMLVARNRRGLCAVVLGDDSDALRAELRALHPGATLTEDGRELAPLLAAVAESIGSPSRDFAEPLDAGGTEFQRRVWRELREIPVGETATYAEVARRIGRPAAVRAVGRACGANPLAVVVPCHRVVRSDGGLSGYRWGVERKRRLLGLEAKAREARTA